MNAQQAFQRLIVVENIDGLESTEALEHLGRLIDVSLDVRRLDGIQRAFQLAEILEDRSLSPTQHCLLNYCLSNAWANYRQLSKPDGQDAWKWEQEEPERQIIHLRRALASDGFQELDRPRQCQILTNLGNLLNTVGRFVEAIANWDEALAILPSFGMAQGNRGYGLTFYARALYDEGHRLVFLRHSYAGLRSALSSDPDDMYGVDSSARDGFSREAAWLESKLAQEYLDKGTSMEEFTLGDSEDEIRYRRWCLHNRLFLNPLNDLGPYSIAARDVLTTPSIVVKAGEGMHYQRFYNQLKQEYASARYLFYEGATSTTPHFSDKGVLLINTLDYPCYSLAVEKVKAAFRVAYSLLDKVSFFLNHYLALGIPERNVRFRSFWYIDQRRQRGLRPEFDACDNWPLRGLFWLSKDLFESDPEFRECLAPDAQEMDLVRNHAEHKYLKLHDELWSGPTDEGRAFGVRPDALAFSVYRSHFIAKALRLLEIARAALIYLSLAIHREERKREKARPNKGFVLPLPVDTWEDEWKR